MKRFIAIALLATIAFLPVFADSIKLGDFPLGKWTDTNYDAVWEFESNNIRILDLNGNVYFDFSETGIQKLKVGAGTDGPYITFSCEASGKDYKIIKPLLKSDMILEIARPDKDLYKVTMPKK